MKLSFEDKIALYNSSNKNKSDKNKDKKISEKKNKTTLYIGKLFGKHPLYSSKKIGQITGKKNTIHLYCYPLFFDNSSNEDSISILFVGQSGTGKTTFINAYANHLLGITIDDDIRYKLILGDESKEKDQTKSQTDEITIYNVRSLKYNNKLFKLIDTPGTGDTRNDNEEIISKLDKDQKEKEFFNMYNNLFSKNIGQLNSITFVIKASENRLNEFQKKIIKNITNLFAGDIEKNCLAILTHTDDFEVIPDAARLLQKMDVFKEKANNNEQWYFPVSSKSYFTPFKKGSYISELFSYTEESFENYTKTLLKLQLYYTKKTQLNLKYKDKQEKILKVLKDDIMDNILDNIAKLKYYEISLKEKNKECEDKRKEINEIKMQIQYEDDLRKIIEENYKSQIAYKSEIEKDLKASNETIQKLNETIKSIYDEIASLERKEINTQEEQSAENSKKKLKNKIEDFENEIRQTNNKIDISNQRMEKLSINIDEIKNKLTFKKAIIKSKDEEVSLIRNSLEEILKDLNKLQREKEVLEKEYKQNKDNAIKQFLIIKIINEEIEKLTLNKSTINSVSELIEQLSLNAKYIDKRKYFFELKEEYYKIAKIIEQSNNKNEIYKKYGLEPDSIRKLENL